MLCIGHRGAAGHEPENTLRSIRRALELGADGIEIDVYAVHGELLVIHDTTLDRTTNGRGRLTDHTLEELRALDAGHGERIPTLAEVFDTVDQRALINIELKGRETAVPTLALIERYVNERGWRHEDFLVSSFRRRELRALKGTPVRRGVLFVRSPWGFARTARDLGAWSVHFDVHFLREKQVSEAHRLGLKVFVYTVNNPGEIARCRAWGVDAIFSDFPDRGR